MSNSSDHDALPMAEVSLPSMGPDRPATGVAQATVADERVVSEDSREPQSRLRLWSRCCSAAEWVFGAVSMLLILAVLATIPVLQMLSLGYLLEVAARVARSGRLRDGFFGIRKAARIGSIVLGSWLLLLPARLASEMWSTAHLIDPNSNVTRGWRVALVIITTLLVAHIVWAWFRGGRLRHFFWPAPLRLLRRIRAGSMYVEARDAVWDFVTELRLPYYFWLGLRGFLGALVWLIVPITLLAVAPWLPNAAAVLSGLIGGLMLVVVLLYLPFLQARFAVENQFRAMFEVRKVRDLFRRAPIAFWIALFATLLFALPLYILKIELTPREVAWLPSLLFVMFIFPARLLTGWALGRAGRREEVRHFAFRWSARLAALPVVAAYTVIVYLTRYFSWYGSLSLYEQHVFLVPVPFLGM